jgi:8-oxo-dGTP diphosphatase
MPDRWLKYWPETRFLAMTYRNPIPTVDIIIEMGDRPHRPIVLIERKYEPLGWAIPGGFVDYGETMEAAARREAQEETGLTVELVEQFQVYSDPARDPRKHTISVVFLAIAQGEPVAADDAKALQLFEPWQIPQNLCFDHDRILQDYLRYRHYGLKPRITP